jgi:hypothetical protein
MEEDEAVLSYIHVAVLGDAAKEFVAVASSSAGAVIDEFLAGEHAPGAVPTARSRVAIIQAPDLSPATSTSSKKTQWSNDNAQSRNTTHTAHICYHIVASFGLTLPIVDEPGCFILIYVISGKHQDASLADQVLSVKLFRSEAKVRYAGIHHVSALVQMDVDDVAKVDATDFELSLRIDTGDEADVSNLHNALIRLSRTDRNTGIFAEAERSGEGAKDQSGGREWFPRCFPCLRRWPPAPGVQAGTLAASSRSSLGKVIPVSGNDAKP